MQALDRLLQRVGDLNDFSRPRPMVTVEEFFDGNDDPGSIGYNLPGGQGPVQLYPVLRANGQRPEVSTVLVEVKDWENEPGWPSADTVYVITTADAETVRSWFPPDLAADEFDVPVGHRAVSCFYD